MKGMVLLFIIPSIYCILILVPLLLLFFGMKKLVIAFLCIWYGTH